MIADTKKVQTMINRVAGNIQSMRNDMADIKLVRDLYIASNADPVGTALDGNVATLNSAINLLDVELSKGIYDQLIAAVVSSHEGDAL